MNKRFYFIPILASFCFSTNVRSSEIVDPRIFGFEIPPAEVHRADGELVFTDDKNGEPVVAKTYAIVGDHRIVMLPDGELVARTKDASPLTDRKYVPLTTEKLAKQLTDKVYAGFRIKRTKHYVYVYNTSEEFAYATSQILESMIPGLKTHAGQLKIPVSEPDVPLVAIMFRTEAEFQNYQRMPTGVVAYYHTLTNHVVMYEESPLWRVKPELAFQQTISTIAHEGAHQILHNIGVQKRLSLWPMWLSEGLAEYYAPTSFGKRLRWKGAGQVNDLRMLELDIFLKSQDADTPTGKLIEDTVSAARLTSTGYASAWALIHFLAKNQKSGFNDLVRAASQLGPFDGISEIVAPGTIPANQRAFELHFGSDLARIETDLVKHMRTLPYVDPFAEWPHWVASIEVPDGKKSKREANVFNSQELAQKWIGDMSRDLTATQREAAVRHITEFPNRPLAVQFTRQYLSRSQ